jgi:hypothetical protein
MSYPGWFACILENPKNAIRKFLEKILAQTLLYRRQQNCHSRYFS